MKTVGVIVGSLRAGSFTKMVARFLSSKLAGNFTIKEIAIGDLPFYNEDQESATPPETWTRFREEVAACDAILFATPEYNRSLPAALKNAIDVGSRPYGKNVWAGKPGAVVSVSPGAIGGMGANFALRQALIFVDVRVMNQPEAYVGSIAKSVDEAGNISNPDTAKYLTGIATGIATWFA
jgi:chromate reductase